ncbi:MAG: TonB-dependent receptor, partial [Prevotella sp.]|nr:TonB-dependent receptor [Prevotella sp.]
GVLKSYVGYDLTSVGQHTDGRDLSLKEHNIYANITHKMPFGHGFSLFTGIANSSVFRDIDDAMTIGDHYHNFRNEVHLKAEVRKVCSDVLKMSAGMEDYIRNSVLRYEPYQYHLDYNILAAHVDAQWRIIPRLFANMSARAEMMDTKWSFLPRTTLSYIPNKCLQAALVLGRYSQTAEDDYLAKSGKSLGQSTADHAILSLQYKTPSTLLRIEPYWKKYHHLPLLENGIYQPHGNGSSRGVDVFLENNSLIKHLTTTLSYSYNDSERLYLDYTSPRMPDFASRHNLRLTAKYGIGKAIIGVAESCTSSRHFPQGKTPAYNSVDINLTYLVSPKVIVYTSLNNILGRTNIFRFDKMGSPVTATRDRFFYIGIFVSLKNNKAYDISNF